MTLHECRSVRAPRVASLLPSATEIVCALGLEQSLVGVSHECDWPATVVGRPVLTSTRVAPGASGAVDADVRRILRDALAVYDIDDDELARARPDVIVTQDLCDVCAVSLDDVVAAARRVVPDVDIVNLHPLRLADIWSDIRKVGKALGRDDEARAVLAAMDRRVDAVRRRAAASPSRPAVLTLEWIDPPMVGGTWMPELVHLAGGTPLVTEPGQHAPTLTGEELAALRPDVVLIKPCGFPVARSLSEWPLLVDLLGRMPWPAVEHGAVWLADGNAFFNRPGPRIVDSLEILAACLHPGLFEDLAVLHAGAFLRLDLAGPAPSM